MTPPNIQRRGNTSPSQTFLKNCRVRNASELTQQSQHHPDTNQTKISHEKGNYNIPDEYRCKTSQRQMMQ